MARDLPWYGDDPDEPEQPSEEERLRDRPEKKPAGDSPEEDRPGDDPEDAREIRAADEEPGAEDAPQPQQPEQRTYWDGAPRLQDCEREPWDWWEDERDRRRVLPVDRSEDPEGSWWGDGGQYLSPEHNAEADGVVDRVRDREEAVTGSCWTWSSRTWSPAGIW